MSRATELLQQAAETSRKESFVLEYQSGITDADALGVALSKWAEWTGDTIAEVFFSALEDANYHTERALFIDLWNDHNGSNLT